MPGNPGVPGEKGFSGRGGPKGFPGLPGRPGKLVFRPFLVKLSNIHHETIIHLSLVTNYLVIASNFKESLVSVD